MPLIVPSLQYFRQLKRHEWAMFASTSQCDGYCSVLRQGFVGSRKRLLRLPMHLKFVFAVVDLIPAAGGFWSMRKRGRRLVPHFRLFGSTFFVCAVLFPPFLRL